jgi:hypothetical protein
VRSRELAPGALFFVALPWLAKCLSNYVEAPLFNDVGMFRYTGWCLLHGETLYKDIVAPDGPFVHFLHAALVLLTGTSAVRFRWLDIAIHSGAGAIVGLLLAPTGARSGGARAAWALLGVTLWLTWCFRLEWAATGQREGFYAVFGFTGMALLYVGSEAAMPRAKWLLLAGGAMAAAPALGKQTCLLYPMLGLLSVVMAKPPIGASRWQRAGLAVAGAVSALALILSGVVAWGSLSGWVFWYFRYSFQVYRYWSQWNLIELFVAAAPENLDAVLPVTIVALAAIAARFLPRRAIGFALAPLLLFAVAVLQGKGWHYQFLPCLLAVHVLLLLMTAELWPEGAAPRATRFGVPARVLGWSALSICAWRCVILLSRSIWLQPTPMVSAAEVTDTLQTADAVRRLTRPEDRVYYYGMFSQILMLAERRPVNPYHVSFFLNFDYALERTSGREHEVIAQMQSTVAADMCDRLMHLRPAAIVLAYSGATSYGDGYDTTVRLCPAAQQLIASEYTLAEQIGPNRIFVRRGSARSPESGATRRRDSDKGNVQFAWR